MTSELQYEQLRSVTPCAAVVLAANPGPMTLSGTNTWVLRAPGSEGAIVVDPGPDDATHLATVAASASRIDTILLTHGHVDHSEGAAALHELTGAPVRALDPRHSLGDEGLAEGAVVSAAGLELRVWATPGHTPTRCRFYSIPAMAKLRWCSPATPILGQGTTVVAYPDGDLADYLASLARLRELGPATVLPGHGPELPSAGEVATAYLAHRGGAACPSQRSARALGPDATAEAIVEQVYADVDRALGPPPNYRYGRNFAYLRDR